MFDEVDPAGLTDDELSAALLEASAAVDRAKARRLAVAAEWDRRNAWAADGAANGRCGLADKATLSRAEAAGLVLRTAKVVASPSVR